MLTGVLFVVMFETSESSIEEHDDHSLRIVY